MLTENTAGHNFLSEGHIEIKSVVVPVRVENGTEDSVILDCIYSYDEEKDKQLVVKWFFNDDPEPIYQWIPELNSRTLSDRLQGKINMDFTVSTGNPYTKYRAINLIRPTVEFSGTYSCHVASLKSQDYKEKKMLVYATPKNITFDLTRNSRTPSSSKMRTVQNNNNHQELVGTKREMMALSDDTNEISPGATLKCFVEEVFPKPEIAIYRLSNDGHRQRLVNSKRLEQITEKRAHNIEISAQLLEVDLINRKFGLPEPNVFECLVYVDINGANVTRSSKLTYTWSVSSGLSLLSALDPMSTCLFVISIFASLHLASHSFSHRI
ncbi:hypothetical protein HDE_07297 [Halotydeus destructor]|nr:hypothetical protein HDE_07297 [Halotydeus destructor]